MGGRLDATDSSSNDSAGMPQVLKLVMIHFLESPFLEVLAMTSLLVDQVMTQ